jgi:rod shape-determining protein MreC
MPEYFYGIREFFLVLSKPIYFLVELPINTFFDVSAGLKDIFLVYSTNKKLIDENKKLQKTHDKNIDLIKENETLRKTLKVKETVQAFYGTVVAKVYLTGKSVINNTLIVNAGVNDGIKEGNIVLGDDKNVIGRVINVGENRSNILLLSDMDSKISARTLNSRKRIIIGGNGSSYLDILHKESENLELDENDLIFTDGTAGLLPDGFFIGTLVRKGDKLSVKMINKSNLFDVIIVTD